MELKLQHHQMFIACPAAPASSPARVKDLMSYFRLLVNPDDDNAYLRVISVPRRKSAPPPWKARQLRQRARHLDVRRQRRSWAWPSTWTIAVYRAPVAVQTPMDKIRKLCAGNDPIGAIRSMIMDIDYENWLRQNASSDKVAEARMGNVWFLVEALKNTLDKDGDGDMTIEDAIGKLVLRDMLERQQEGGRRRRGVQMMTIRLQGPGVPLGVHHRLGGLLPPAPLQHRGRHHRGRAAPGLGITRAKRNLA